MVEQKHMKVDLTTKIGLVSEYFNGLFILIFLAFVVLEIKIKFPSAHI